MIDIIIPFKSDIDLLKRCLYSIKCQTDQNFTVTIVNDDPDIKYDFIEGFKVVNNATNLGTGLSRQVGINNTSSDYIMFVDSDDLLYPYTVELFNKAVEINSPELIVSPFLIKNSQGTKIDIYINDINTNYTWTHGKLYSREFLNKYNIRFIEKYSHWLDDGYFNSLVFGLVSPSKIGKISLPTYLWYQNSNSVTHTAKLTQTEKDILLLEAMIDSSKIVRSYGKLVTYNKNVVNMLCYRIPYSDRTVKEQELIDILNNINEGSDINEDS